MFLSSLLTNLLLYAVWGYWRESTSEREESGKSCRLSRDPQTIAHNNNNNNNTTQQQQQVVPFLFWLDRYLASLKGALLSLDREPPHFFWKEKCGIYSENNFPKMG